MKLKTPVTKEKLRNHFTYGLWKYALMALLVAFGLSLLFTTTAYHSPEDKRIDVYVMTGTTDTDKINAVLKPIWENVTPEVETVNSVALMVIDDYTTTMQLSAYMAAAEGDIYILPESYFKMFAGQGCFLPLEQLVEDGTLDLGEMDLGAGWVTVVEDYDDNDNPINAETHLCGIPMKEFTGMKDQMQVYDYKNMYASIMVMNGNDENVVPFFAALMDTLKGPTETAAEQ